MTATSDLKLYRVRGTCEIEYVVAAENETEAVEMGERYFYNAYVDDCLTEPDIHVVRRVENHHDLPTGYGNDSPPYGPPEAMKSPIYAWLAPDGAHDPNEDDEVPEDEPVVKPLPGQSTLFGDVVE